MRLRKITGFTAALALALPALAAATPAASGIGSPAASTDPMTVKPGLYALDPAHGKITWSVDHLGYSTYIGQIGGVGAKLSLRPGDLPQSELSVTVNMNGLGTLNPELDQVLKGPEFFDVKRYPTANFVSTRILRTGRNSANVDGALTLHGKTQPVVLKVVFNQAGLVVFDHAYVAGFSATAVIQRSEFGLGAYTGLISDAVPLQIEGEFQLRK